MTPKVLHLSTSGASGGGAGRAAAALHDAMRAQGVDSQMWNAHGARFRAAQQADRLVWRLQRSPVRTWRSPARFGSLSAAHINGSDADVVNLHWVTNGFLSIEQIGRIEKPLVWSLYDMWPFCGTEHYGVDSAAARWRTGYTAGNRPADESGIDIDRDAWDRKRRLWRASPVVAASTWLEGVRAPVRAHAELAGEEGPHVIDTTAFAPMPRDAARQRLRIDDSGPVILFLSSGGIHDPRKGFDLLDRALHRVGERFPNARLAVVGPSDESRTHAGGVPIMWFGTASGNAQLQALYCAADVTAVPSREDNMPLTAMEAQACGSPVAAFRIGGLPDIVDHLATGYLAPEGDTDALADALIVAIEDSLGVGAWGSAARARAESLWSTSVVVRQYLDVYERAIA